MLFQADGVVRNNGAQAPNHCVLGVARVGKRWRHQCRQHSDAERWVLLGHVLGVDVAECDADAVQPLHPMLSVGRLSYFDGVPAARAEVRQQDLPVNHK